MIVCTRYVHCKFTTLRFSEYVYGEKPSHCKDKKYLFDFLLNNHNKQNLSKYVYEKAKDMSYMDVGMFRRSPMTKIITYYYYKEKNVA